MENLRVIERLKDVCETESGFLTIVRMDNYDTFREIYGEDMSDVLRDECVNVIRRVTNEDDIKACLGGEEFVIFCKNLKNKQEITEMYFYITKCVNEEVEKIIGDGDSIYIDMSMGAVMVPEYGRDYVDLFVKADMVLDIMKNEGRHSISFYDMIDESEFDKDANKGAMLVDQDQFDTIREFMSMYVKTYKSSAGELNIYIRYPEDDLSFEDDSVLAKKCAGVIQQTLRRSDVITLDGNHIKILLPEISRQNLIMVAYRIEEKLYKADFGDNIRMNMDSKLISPDREMPVALEVAI